VKVYIRLNCDFYDIFFEKRVVSVGEEEDNENRPGASKNANIFSP